MTITLEIGKRYKTRKGLEATCVGVNPYPHSTNDNWIVAVNKSHTHLSWYFENGNWMAEHQENDEIYDMDIVEAIP